MACVHAAPVWEDGEGLRGRKITDRSLLSEVGVWCGGSPESGQPTILDEIGFLDVGEREARTAAGDADGRLSLRRERGSVSRLPLERMRALAWSLDSACQIARISATNCGLLFGMVREHSAQCLPSD